MDSAEKLSKMRIITAKWKSIRNAGTKSCEWRRKIFGEVPQLDRIGPGKNRGNERGQTPGHPLERQTKPERGRGSDEIKWDKRTIEN
jgi:hypothetical protein